MKIKVKKKLRKIDVFYDKLIVCRNLLIGMTAVMIPIVFFLYVLNAHNYIFPRILEGDIIFRLDLVYRFLVFIFAFIYIFDMIYKKSKPSKSDWFLYLFILMTIISSIFAFNKEIALYGYPNRNEGMFTLLFYAFLYLNCARLKDQALIKRLTKIIIGTTFIQFLFILMQMTGIYKSFIYMYSGKNIIGLTQNCNFLGSFMCLMSMLSLCAYTLKIEKKNAFYYIAFIVSFISLLLANSSGPFLGLLGSIFIFAIYLLIKRREVWQRFAVIIITMLCLYPIVLSKNDNITPEIKANISYIINLFKSDDKTDNNSSNKNDITRTNDLGNGRIRIWKNTMKSVKERPLLGFGPDNLGLIYKKSFDDNKIADKAHNIYLHIWVSSGIFALIGYLGFTLLNMIKAFKSKNVWVITILFGIIAYSLQGLFNINVIEVTPYFYLLLGFMMSIIKNNIE